MDGTYFSHDAYAITSASASNSQVAFVITCTAASSTRSGKPSTPAMMTLTSSASNNYVPTFAEAAPAAKPLDETARRHIRAAVACRGKPRFPNAMTAFGNRQLRLGENLVGLFRQPVALQG